MVGLAFHRRLLDALSPRRPALVRKAGVDDAAAIRLERPYLTPDQRLLQAVGEVHRILTGRPFEPAQARFESGAWHIAHQSVDVGVVPEFPDFDDMSRLLVVWAQRLGARDVFAARPKDESLDAVDLELDAMHALLAASECDRLARAGSRSAEVLRRGARALVMLELETTDLVGVSDRVAARAMALVATCQAIDSTALRREQCLLAHCMGYGAHAWAAAERLPESDPIRLFVLQEDSLLTAVATAQGASREAGFLHLRRLARARDLEGWSAWVRRSYTDDPSLSLPVLGTAFSVGKFETHLPAAGFVLLQVSNELRLLEALADADSAHGSEPTVGALAQEFEKAMNAMQASADGIFLDRDLLRATYRAGFYSSLWTMGEYYRRARSSLPGTSQFADELKGLTAGPGAEFARWDAHLAEAKAGRANLAELQKDLGRLPSFGARMVIQTCDQVRELSPDGSLQPRLAAVAVAARLDTRPAHRLELGRIAGLDLLMLPLAEDLAASAAQASSPLDAEARGRWARLTDDRTGLEALLTQPDLTAAQEAVLLANLREVSSADSASVCAAYQRCLARHPDSWQLVFEFADYAGGQLEAYPLARSAIERWRARHRRQNDMEALLATVSLARTYEREGRWAEALRIAGPLAKSQQLGAMERTAMALEHLGRTAEAETLAVFAWQRYPDNAEAQSLVADILWRHGKHDQAAEALSNPRFPLSSDEWRWTLAPRFVQCFGEGTDEALKAVEALAKTELPGPATLGALATGCGDEGRSDLAFAIEQKLDTHGDEKVRQVFQSYDHLAHWKGRSAGLEWLRPRLAALGRAERAAIRNEAFRNGAPELLWELDLDPRGADGEFQWLMRAAAARRWPDVDPGHEKALAAHFDQATGDRYRTLGRYLLGLEADSTVRALADGPEHECEVSYYWGVRAQGEGRYRDAAESYERCVATHHTRAGEYQWAYAQLIEWQGRKLTLGKLAEIGQRERGAAGVAAGARLGPPSLAARP